MAVKAYKPSLRMLLCAAVLCGVTLSSGFIGGPQQQQRQALPSCMYTHGSWAVSASQYNTKGRSRDEEFAAWLLSGGARQPSSKHRTSHQPSEQLVDVEEAIIYGPTLQVRGRTRLPNPMPKRVTRIWILRGGKIVNPATIATSRISELVLEPDTSITLPQPLPATLKTVTIRGNAAIRNINVLSESNVERLAFWRDFRSDPDHPRLQSVTIPQVMPSQLKLLELEDCEIGNADDFAKYTLATLKLWSGSTPLRLPKEPPAALNELHLQDDPTIANPHILQKYMQRIGALTLQGFNTYTLPQPMPENLRTLTFDCALTNVGALEHSAITNIIAINVRAPSRLPLKLTTIKFRGDLHPSWDNLLQTAAVRQKKLFHVIATDPNALMTFPHAPGYVRTLEIASAPTALVDLEENQLSQWTHLNELIINNADFAVPAHLPPSLKTVVLRGDKVTLRDPMNLFAEGSQVKELILDRTTYAVPEEVRAEAKERDVKILAVTPGMNV